MSMLARLAEQWITRRLDGRKWVALRTISPYLWVRQDFPQVQARAQTG